LAHVAHGVVEGAERGAIEGRGGCARARCGGGIFAALGQREAGESKKGGGYEDVEHHPVVGILLTFTVGSSSLLISRLS
jgi:hypothetical protein